MEWPRTTSRSRSKLTRRRSPLRVRAVYFAPHWSTKQTFTGEFELQPDGSVQVTVEGDTISGTENRKGVTGVFQGTGS